VLAAFASFWTHDIFHPLSGPGYQFWSGAGSDLSELTLLGLLIGGWRAVNCHVPHCLRLGRHPTADGHYKLCRKHHPDLPDSRPSLEQIHAAHSNAKARNRMSADAEIGRTTHDDTW
jgi:hypothetical protein